jgi:hypothetical protein
MISEMDNAIDMAEIDGDMNGPAGRDACCSVFVRTSRRCCGFVIDLANMSGGRILQAETLLACP